MYFFNKKTKILRGFALVCVLALGLCMTGGLQMAEAKTTTYYDASAGRLHVKGTKLVDKKGHEVQLRGVSTLRKKQRPFSRKCPGNLRVTTM